MERVYFSIKYSLCGLKHALSSYEIISSLLKFFNWTISWDLFLCWLMPTITDPNPTLYQRFSVKGNEKIVHTQSLRSHLLSKTNTPIKPINQLKINKEKKRSFHAPRPPDLTLSYFYSQLCLPFLDLFLPFGKIWTYLLNEKTKCL